jgi:O-antigen/teichoic acid export membrane protein
LTKQDAQDVEDDKAAAARLQTSINRGVAWIAASQVIVAVADIIAVLLVVALMDQANYGVMMAGVGFYAVLDVTADFGVTSAIIQRDDHNEDRISTVFWFNVLVSAGMFGALCIIAPLYGASTGYPIVGWLLIAYSAKLLLQNVYAIPYALLRKELRFATVAKIRTSAYVVESILRVVFAATGFGVWCYTLAAIARTVTFGVLIQVARPFLPRLVFKFREVLPYVKFGLRSASSQILYYTYTNIDYQVVLYFFGPQANAIYSFAYWIVLEAVKTIANVVIDVAFPTFARLRNDPEALKTQFIRLTRLNMMAVLPFVLLIMLCVPDLLAMFGTSLSTEKGWTAHDLELCANAARLLALVGLLRALGFLGPPLLDGTGQPQLTLRYMASASVLVPLAFVTAAATLGDRIGLISVAIGWAVGYPIAFVVLMYLVVRSIHLEVPRYLRASGGILACAAAGLVVGGIVSLAIGHVGHLVDLVASGGSALATMFLLLAYWQDVHPRSMLASLK